MGFHHQAFDICRHARDKTSTSFLNLVLGPTKHVHDRPTREAKRALLRKDFEHFGRVLRIRIREFSATEKVKIDCLFAEQPTGAKEQPRFSFQWDQRPELIPHSELYNDMTGNSCLEENLSSFSIWKIPNVQIFYTTVQKMLWSILSIWIIQSLYPSYDATQRNVPRLSAATVSCGLMGITMVGVGLLSTLCFVMSCWMFS